MTTTLGVFSKTCEAGVVGSAGMGEGARMEEGARMGGGVREASDVSGMIVLPCCDRKLINVISKR